MILPMHPFFRGWRRKAGVVTLVMACALMSGWVRSFRIHDQLWFAVRGDATEAVISLGGKINWIRYHKAVLVPVPTFPEWTTGGFDDVESFDDGSLRRRWRFVGFVSGEWPDDKIIGRTTIVAVPYLMLVMPLTLLSAYLILWKPRKRATPPT